MEDRKIDDNSQFETHKCPVCRLSCPCGFGIIGNMKAINGMKWCPRCKMTKKVNEFHKMSSTYDGYKVYCKLCASKEYLKNQKHYCKQNSQYIYKTKLRAFEIVADGNKIACAKHKEWGCCDKNDIDFLSLDHIKGDGASHRREIGFTASTSLYRWVIKNPTEAKKRLQILCMNAQVKKKKLNHEQHYERRNN